MVTKCTQPGRVALTFDDGPYTYTNEMLSVLDRLGVKATFFISGNNRGKGSIDNPSNEWRAMLTRMYESGHQIASHTWTHRDLNKVNESVRRVELIHNEMALRNIFGWIPTYMRPPFLECASECKDTARSLGYHAVTTNLDTKDYMYDDPSLIQESKTRFAAGLSTEAGSNSYIVLAHDVHRQTVVNLTSFMVNLARERGYKLVTVGECLDDPRQNWYRVTQSPPVTETRTSRAPLPTETVIVSPDQRCGGNTSFTCQGSGFGNCCSFYGYWYVSRRDELWLRTQRIGP